LEGLAYYALCYLAAAVLAVIVSQRVGLGSVVGYIAAGVLIGPVFQISVAGSGYLEQFSEFGIVMMLFLIGLEIDPQMVWRLRNKLLGLGGLQVVATIAAVTASGVGFGFHWQESVIFGFIAALSSTAIVLQTLEEKGLLRSDGGQASFAVLLFQDLAVIPMLACIPLFAGSGHGPAAGHGGAALIAGLPGWATAVLTLAAVGVVVAAAHYLSRPVFRTIALLGLREVFTAAALLVVVGITVLMSAVGLSPALGAFLGGVVLANSEFKHELQNDIEPFKGLLLGLFFMTIGAKIDPEILMEDWITVVAATSGLIMIKAIVLLPLAWFFRVRGPAGWLFTLGLAQAGEFGFVLLAIGGDRGLLTPSAVSVSVLIITFSMVLTPLLFALSNKIVVMLESRGRHQRDADQPDKGNIILAGVGRFGQIVNRVLLANGYKPVVLDYRADVVDNVRKFGVKSFFGDAGRPDLLESAGIGHAALLIVAIDDPDRATEIVAYARRSNPNIRIIVRAYDRLHHYKLLDAGADHIIREMFDGSVQAAGMALEALGMHPYEVEKRKAVFVEQDTAGLARMAKLVDVDTPAASNPDFVAGFNDIGKVIENAMMGYRSGYDEMVARGWNAPDAGSIHVPRSKNQNNPA
jgi:CPA2 family monovalent cation:H+ antiporter-2